MPRREVRRFEAPAGGWGGGSDSASGVRAFRHRFKIWFNSPNNAHTTKKGAGEKREEKGPVLVRHSSGLHSLQPTHFRSVVSSVYFSVRRFEFLRFVWPSFFSLGTVVPINFLWEEKQRQNTEMGLKGSKPKLSKEDLEFLKKNTNFTEEQIKEWYKGFVQDCPKGHLTKEQFIKVYKDFFPSGSAEGFCEHVFRTFDTDNSGFIDFKEFLLAINVTSSGTPEQKLEWAFRMYDIDGNGTIDEKEMIKIIEAIYEMLGPEVTKSADDSPRKRAKMIFEKMDVNNDKELTLKEFVDGCLADKELFQILTNEVKK
ncbi:hypothetical protein niasHT_012010 [Heterodera trifolii]|uniref:EF-hand domain-containing protein n=1 Tax=Heterodera trifolii TaxID=157864 RepID=A0ABD2KUW9_9BILA